MQAGRPCAAFRFERAGQAQVCISATNVGDFQSSASKVRCLTEALRALSSWGGLYIALRPPGEAAPPGDWQMAVLGISNISDPH